MRLYDQKGNPIEVPDAEAPAALSSGKYGLPKGSAVPVVTKQGKVGDVPVEQAGAAFADGARVATGEEVHHAALETKYGGIGGQLATAGIEGVNQATLGLSNFAAGKLGGEGTRRYIEEHNEVNPNARIVGGVIGAVAPAIATAGESAALEGAGALRAAGEAAEGAGALSGVGSAARTVAKVVSAPSLGASKLAGGVERVVQGALGEGSGSLVSAFARKALAKGAGAAAEGALVNTGQQLSEDSIGNTETNGEKLLASLGHGALLGLGAGVGLTAAGELGRAVLGKAMPKLSGMAEEQAVRAIDPRKQFVKELEKMPGGTKAAGRRLLDDGVIGAGDRMEDIAPKISEARKAAGEKLGTILDTADEHGLEGVSLKNIQQAVETDLLPNLSKLKKTNAGAIKKVQDMLSDLEGFAGVPSAEVAAEQGMDRALLVDHAKLTFRQAQDFRSQLDDVIRWNSNPMGPVNEGTEAMKKLRGIIEGEVESGVAKTAKALGSEFADSYKEAKLAYRQYAVMDKAATDALAAQGANRILSPTDYITGAAAFAHHTGKGAVGALLGAGAGEAEGGDTGSVIGGAVSGAVAAMAHHAIRTRGNATAAFLLDKVSALRGVERAAQSIDTQIDRGISGIVREEGRVPVRTKFPIEGEAGEHPYRTSVRRVLQEAGNAEAHSEKVSSAASAIEPHAPKTSNAFQRAALRGTMYLAQQVPKSQPEPSVTPQFDSKVDRVSDAEKADYMRKVTAVHDPMSVLADMSQGKATKSQVDALKAVYPSLYQEVVQRTQDKLASLKKPLDYGQKLQIGLLLGVPADETMKPDFVKAMQQSYAPPQGQAAPAGKHHKQEHTQRALKGTISDNVKLTI